jgi:hypothetical protein
LPASRWWLRDGRNSRAVPGRGVVQKIRAIAGLEVGIDACYKIAQDLLDDGQFGQAYVLSGFNYASGINEGLELKANYVNGNFRAWGNLGGRPR